MLVRITIFLIIVTAVWFFLVTVYAVTSPQEILKLKKENKHPWYITVASCLLLADIVGILASAFYLLFLR